MRTIIGILLGVIVGNIIMFNYEFKSLIHECIILKRDIMFIEFQLKDYELQKLKNDKPR
jgi:hypothetical protein